MQKKLTIEEFKLKKAELLKIVEEVEKEYNTAEKTYLDNLVKKYEVLQTELLSNDLSSIPSNEWKNLPLVATENSPVDFSTSHANLDFSIFAFSIYANYKGCNLSNLSRINIVINSANFDEEVVRSNPELFISDNFSSEIKEKVYTRTLTIADLFSLTEDQLKELLTKKIINNIDFKTRRIIETVGFDHTLELYSLSKKDYQEVYDILNNYASYQSTELSQTLKSAKVSELKNKTYEYLKNIIMNEPSLKIDLQKLPEEFITENKDILLLDTEIPDSLREKYYSKNLTLDDLLENAKIFKNIPIANFISKGEEYHDILTELSTALGKDTFQALIELFPKHLNYILKGHLANQFYEKITELKVLENSPNTNSAESIKNYLAIFFTTHNSLRNKDQLLLYEEDLFKLDPSQKAVIKLLSLENIQRFEKETGFFSHEMPNLDEECLPILNLLSLGLPKRDSQKLTYEEFENTLAKLINNIRKTAPYGITETFDWMEGDFREKHPELFISHNAPKELRNAFNNNKITPELIRNHPEYIPYLIDKNIEDIIPLNIDFNIYEQTEENFTTIPGNFMSEYSKRYGNEKLLQLIAKYGNHLNGIEILSISPKEMDNEKFFQFMIRRAIYGKIIRERNLDVDYSNLLTDPDFIKEHPDIYIDFDSLTEIEESERERLKQAFYKRKITYDDVRKNKSLVEALKDKKLDFIFPQTIDNNFYQFGDIDLLRVLGNEKFLILCSKYGNYMSGVMGKLQQKVTIMNGQFTEFSKKEDDTDDVLSFEEISKRIEKIIAENCFSGITMYSKDTAPSFLKENYSELFLSDDAPEKLKEYFYSRKGIDGLTFNILKEHKDWLPYLKGKSILTPILRTTPFKKEMQEYFELFETETALKLGMNKTKTVNRMLGNNQVSLMKFWYDKTGHKFIPSFIVMQNFPEKEIDKFLTSSTNWSNLMRIKSFNDTEESIEAMLKIAYSFGAFDQDQRGYKKLQELLTDIPRKISGEYGYIVEMVDVRIEKYQDSLTKRLKNNKENPSSLTSKRLFQELIKEVEQDNCRYTNSVFDNDTLLKLLKSLEAENIEIDFTKGLFSQIYHKNENSSYTLSINPQNIPKTKEAVREILEKFGELPIITPDKAHRLFGGFDLKYDPDFREFFLENIENILENPEYSSLLSNIQKQFSDIKRINSNRHLTLELATSYVKTNQYTSVSTGNEEVAEISSIAGYSQRDFEVLQQIYNYGKQRIFSSIPRIENKTDKYTYEMLRLDDPLAMAIGTLTDCCQELGNAAESCMQHSMVDKNGRAFVIKDKEGKIVAQSWVWRNKDVICFDNIEIPSRAFPKENKEEFTDEIYEIYKRASKELIEQDEAVYKRLLETGKITKEQYEGMRLGKVTVGLGYNDIAVSIKQNAKRDTGILAKPLPYQNPVKLQRGLYTNDSNTQYILEEIEKESPEKFLIEEPLQVHSDTYTLYDDDSFNEQRLLRLEKLELVTKNNPMYLDTSLPDSADPKHLVTALARNYDLNKETTKVILSPNFAIIFDTSADTIRIGELLFNTQIKDLNQDVDITNTVATQIGLALNQISVGKEVDISRLDKKQQEMYTKAMNIGEEIDKERGISHAR